MDYDRFLAAGGCWLAPQQAPELARTGCHRPAGGASCPSIGPGGSPGSTEAPTRFENAVATVLSFHDRWHLPSLINDVAAFAGEEMHLRRLWAVSGRSGASTASHTCSPAVPGAPDIAVDPEKTGDAPHSTPPSSRWCLLRRSAGRGPIHVRESWLRLHNLTHEECVRRGE